MTLQGIIAVVAGFIGMAAIVMAGSALAAVALGRSLAATEQPPPGKGYLVFDFTLGMVAAAGGGLITAWLAPFAPMAHGIALAGLVLAMAGVCLLGYGDKGPPRWYQAVLSLASAAVVVVITALAGS